MRHVFSVLKIIRRDLSLVWFYSDHLPHNLNNQKQPLENFYKKNPVLKNFAIFTRRSPYWSLFFLKLKAFRSATLLRRDSKTCFLVNMIKFLRAPILKNISERLLLNNSISNIGLFDLTSKKLLRKWCFFPVVLSSCDDITVYIYISLISPS